MPETIEVSPIDYNIIHSKQCRVELDNALQSVKRLSSSREVSISITKVEEAIMWLGMNLKRLGTPNPYPNSRDVANTIVDKTADNLKF